MANIYSLVYSHGIAAILPVKPKALELLEKYKYQMPKTTNAEANRKIKQKAAYDFLGEVDLKLEKHYFAKKIL